MATNNFVNAWVCLKERKDCRAHAAPRTMRKNQNVIVSAFCERIGGQEVVELLEGRQA